MNQFSKNTDVRLHNISHRIGQAEKEIEEATTRKDEAWDEAKDLFGELAEDMPSPRFIADDGYTLTLQRREGTPKLDEAMLQALLFQQLDKAAATKLWNSVTKRVIDSNALEAAIRTQKISPEIVEQCMTPATVSYARVRRSWTKEDRERAKIFGIEKGE